MFQPDQVAAVEDMFGDIRENQIVLFMHYDLVRDEEFPTPGVVIKVIKAGEPLGESEDDFIDLDDKINYLIRLSTGEEINVIDEKVTHVVKPEAFDEMIRLYMLSQFLRFKEQDVPEYIDMRIEAAASSSSRELAIKFGADIGYSSKYFRSDSLNTSVGVVINRYFEDKGHEVKALPAY